MIDQFSTIEKVDFDEIEGLIKQLNEQLIAVGETTFNYDGALIKGTTVLGELPLKIFQRLKQVFSHYYLGVETEDLNELEAQFKSGSTIDALNSLKKIQEQLIWIAENRNVSQINTCAENCMGGCYTTCSQTCGNNCSGTCSGSCSNNCSANCGNVCNQSCAMNCTGACEWSCSGGCSTTCRGGCSTTCSGGCEGSAKCTSCKTAACATSCSSSCKDSCQGSCIGTCNNTCTGKAINAVIN